MSLVLHREALDPERRTLIPALAAFPEFVLAGGTALALQIGHRVSVDFDFFSADEIPATLLARLECAFAGYVLAPSVNNRAELTVFAAGTKLTFLHYPFPVFDLPPVTFEELRLLSIRRLAATKAYTIGRRGSFRDYIDIYFMLAGGHLTLGELIADAEGIYGEAFNARLFLEQLIYLDDVADDTALRFIARPVTRAELLSYFEARIKEIRL